MAENNNRNDLSLEDLQAELSDLETSYRDLKFDHFTKGLANPIDLRSYRRDIARVKTELRKRELEGMSEEDMKGRSRIRKRRSRQQSKKN